MVRSIYTVILLICVFAGCITAAAQSSDTFHIHFPENAAVPGKLKKQIAEIRKLSEQRFQQESETIRNLPLTSVLAKMEEGSNYRDLLMVRYWMTWHYRDGIPELILRLRNKRVVGLTGYDDTIIWERVRSGHMKYYGQGQVISDDLFTVAGRANWLLKEITGEKVGNVSVYSGNQELGRLQLRWINWLKGLSITD